MLIESESPFMVPAQYRGKRNKPSFIHSTAEFLAGLRDMDQEECAQILRSNARTLFGLPE
jgi:TatD DNase family protein